MIGWIVACVLYGLGIPLCLSLFAALHGDAEYMKRRKAFYAFAVFWPVISLWAFSSGLIETARKP